MQIKNISRNRLGHTHDRHWRLTLSLSWSKCKFCHCFNEIGLAYTRWNSNGLRSRTWMLSFTMIKPSKPRGYNLSFLTVKFENDSFEAMVIKFQAEFVAEFQKLQSFSWNILRLLCENSYFVGSFNHLTTILCCTHSAPRYFLFSQIQKMKTDWYRS